MSDMNTPLQSTIRSGCTIHT